MHTDIRRILDGASVAERMYWASSRKTTKIEDISYCLLGIFGIRMPLLYGEGQNAFRRLQEEIARQSDDQSLFAWNQSTIWGSILAESSENFIGSSHLVPQRTGSLATSFTITNKGIVLTLPVLEVLDLGNKVLHALLECSPRNDPGSLVVLELRHLHGDVYKREPFLHAPGFVTRNAWHQWSKRTIVSRRILAYTPSSLM